MHFSKRQARFEGPTIDPHTVGNMSAGPGSRGKQSRSPVLSPRGTSDRQPSDPSRRTQQESRRRVAFDERNRVPEWPWPISKLARDREVHGLRPPPLSERDRTCLGQLESSPSSRFKHRLTCRCCHSSIAHVRLIERFDELSEWRGGAI